MGRCIQGEIVTDEVESPQCIENAKDLKIDAQKIIMGGGSAGANLVRPAVVEASEA